MVESNCKPNQRLHGMLTLPDIDHELKQRHHGRENAHHVYDSYTYCEELKRQIEQVGQAYESLKKRVYKQLTTREENKHQGYESSSESEEEEEKVTGDEHQQDWEKKRRKRTKEEIEKEALLMENLYAILGIDHLGFEAGDGDIKSAYRKLALIYHPDKLGESITATEKEVWLKVQNAYETLIDPIKRKKFDSSLPFNDNIPSEMDNINDETFWDIFTPVFTRNAKFAKKKPVPNLGDPNTPIDQVHKFYKYWDSFDTWRDFSNFDEYDVREAADRYERRYMEKENKKIRDKYMKKERQRLITLVELAYKYDPRIKQQRLMEEQEKQRKKQEQRDKKERERKEIEDRQREIEEAKQREIQKQQEEAKRIKGEKDAALKRRKEVVKELWTICEERLPGSKYDKFFFEEYCKKIKTTEEIQSITQQLSSASKDQDEFKNLLETLMMQNDLQVEEQKQQLKKESQVKQKEEAKKGEWTADEISKLSKAIVKFPGSVPDRWKLITDFIGTDKTSKQVVAKAQELAKRTSLSAAGKTVVNSSYTEKQQKEEKKQQAKVEKKKDEENNKEAANKSDDKKDKILEGDWTIEQQKQLELGMREFPGSMSVKERWIKIAEKVDGKGAKECYERFKEICAKLKKQQETKQQ